MAARHHTLSWSIASLHGDEQAVGAPLTTTELTALARTRLFGATGTVLMAIGALGAGARPVVQDPTFGVRLLNLPSRIQTVSLTMTTTGAVMMALAWLMLGRFTLGRRRMSRGELDRTLLLWMLPLLIAPPMYSKDVYSYLAQSEIGRDGLDPYRVGPASGLGLGHVFTLSVPSLWRETPAPYGPLFLWIGRGISSLTGENIVAAVLCHRLVVLIGVTLIVWATPRLAQRCGVAEVSALWLGAANPLLIMHLVAGIHNEALMLGLMLTGVEFALRGLDMANTPRPSPETWRLGPATIQASRRPELGASPRAGREPGSQTPSGMGAPGHAAGGFHPDHAVVASEATLAAGDGLRHDSAGIPLGWQLASTAARRRCDGESNAGDNGHPGLGQRSRIRLDQHAGHRQCGAQLDVAADTAGPGHRARRHPAGPG